MDNSVVGCVTEQLLHWISFFFFLYRSLFLSVLHLVYIKVPHNEFLLKNKKCTKNFIATVTQAKVLDIQHTSETEKVNMLHAF